MEKNMSRACINSNPGQNHLVETNKTEQGVEYEQPAFCLVLRREMDQHHVEDESGDDEKEDLPRRRFNIEVNDNGLYCFYGEKKQLCGWTHAAEIFIQEIELLISCIFIPLILPTPFCIVSSFRTENWNITILGCESTSVPLLK